MSGESSFRIQSKAHRERSQPSSRKKLGLLEKHKDYVVRSQDYKKKQKFIKTLKTKANERNPDEFYFNMHKSKVVDGKHTKLINGSLDNDTIKLLKTQDMNYILFKKSIDDKKIDKLQANLHKISKNGVTSINNDRSHIIFLDNESEFHNLENHRKSKNSNGSTTSILKAKPSIMSLDIDSSSLLNSNHAIQQQRNITKQHSESDIKKIKKLSNATYKELNQRISRSKQLTGAMTELALQRQLMGKGTKRKLTMKDPNNKDKDIVVYKWKRERRK